MEQNFIKIFHQFLSWEWYQDINAKTLFLHCLLKANCEPKKWHGSTIETGSFVTSLPILATELNISVQQVRTALSKLKSTGEITDKSTNEYRVISIVNWEEYQDNQQTKQQVDNRRVTDEITGKSTNEYRVIPIINREEYQDNQQTEQQTDNRQYKEQQVDNRQVTDRTTDEITGKSTNEYRVIPIINREEYQDNQQTEQQTDKNQITGEQQADNSYFKKKELKEIKNIKKESTEKVFLGLIENYTTNLELRTTILDFVQMRKVIKKPMTERALTLLFGKLAKAGNEGYQISVLEQSILNNWQDIYKLRNDSTLSPLEKKYEDFGKKYEKIDIQEKSKQNCQDFLAAWEASE